MSTIEWYAPAHTLTYTPSTAHSPWEPKPAVAPIPLTGARLGSCPEHSDTYHILQIGKLFLIVEQIYPHQYRNPPPTNITITYEDPFIQSRCGGMHYRLPTPRLYYGDEEQATEAVGDHAYLTYPHVLEIRKPATWKTLKACLTLQEEEEACAYLLHQPTGFSWYVPSDGPKEFHPEWLDIQHAYQQMEQLVEGGIPQ